MKKVLILGLLLAVLVSGMVVFAADTFTIPKVKSAITIDGDASDWEAAGQAYGMIVLSSDMVADKKTVDNNKDVSAIVYVGWDDSNLYLCFKRVDDKACFPLYGSDGSYSNDAIEFWVNNSQICAAKTQKADIVYSWWKSKTLKKGYQMAWVANDKIGDSANMGEIVKQAGDRGTVGGAPGAVVEMSMSWNNLDMTEVKAGAKLQFAVGTDDNDNDTEREGQLYWPKTWAWANPTTFQPSILGE